MASAAASVLPRQGRWAVSTTAHRHESLLVWIWYFGFVRIWLCPSTPFDTVPLHRYIHVRTVPAVRHLSEVLNTLKADVQSRARNYRTHPPDDEQIHSRLYPAVTKSKKLWVSRLFTPSFPSLEAIQALLFSFDLVLILLSLSVIGCSALLLSMFL